MPVFLSFYFRFLNWLRRSEARLIHLYCTISDLTDQKEKEEMSSKSLTSGAGQEDGHTTRKGQDIADKEGTDPGDGGSARANGEYGQEEIILAAKKLRSA